MWSGSWMHCHLWSKANRFPTGGLWGCSESDVLVRTPLVLALSSRYAELPGDMWAFILGMICVTRGIWLPYLQADISLKEEKKMLASLLQLWKRRRTFRHKQIEGCSYEISDDILGLYFEDNWRERSNLSIILLIEYHSSQCTICLNEGWVGGWQIMATNLPHPCLHISFVKMNLLFLSLPYTTLPLTLGLAVWLALAN